MRLTEARVYRGPNLYGYRPVIRWILDLEELEQQPNSRLSFSVFAIRVSLRRAGSAGRTARVEPPGASGWRLVMSKP